MIDRTWGVAVVQAKRNSSLYENEDKDGEMF